MKTQQHQNLSVLANALSARTRYNLGVLSIVSLTIVFFGSSLNSNNHKYVRTTVGNSLNTLSPSVDNLDTDALCTREVFLINVPDSRFCCEGLRRQDWVCIASFDQLNMIMTSLPWAYVFPIIPWLSSVVLSHNSRMHVHLRRLAIYIIIFLFRAFILYTGFSVIQRTFNDLFYETNLTNKCWYRHLLKSNSCTDFFDFSDHIVFHFANVLVPCVLEMSWMTNDVASSSIPNGKKINWSRCVPTLIFALALCFLSLRSMMFTSMYFHTFAECVVALLLTLGIIIFPIFYNMENISLRLLATD